MSIYGRKGKKSSDFMTQKKEAFENSMEKRSIKSHGHGKESLKSHANPLLSETYNSKAF